MNDKRFEELETRIAFQEDLLQKLDDALAGQQKQLFDLQARLAIVTKQVRELEPVVDQDPDSDRPPHY